VSDTFWQTSLSSVEENKILIRGYRVQELMEHCSFGDVVYLTFKGELPKGREGKILEMIFVSSTDHSVLAPSIDATRFVASAGTPLQAAVAAGVIGLGEHHGGAIEQSAKLLQESVAAGRGADEIVRGYKERKQRIPGMGHPIHSQDPRSLKLVAKAKEWNLDGPHLALGEAIASQLKLPLNVDGAIAGITSDMGIPWQYGKAFFIIPRVVGLSAHAVEEITRERPFRAVSMKDVTYDGPAEREIPEGHQA
jgi:citrate synthase